MHARASVDDARNEDGASPVSRLQSHAWWISCLARFARRAKERETARSLLGILATTTGTSAKCKLYFDWPSKSGAKVFFLVSTGAIIGVGNRKRGVHALPSKFLEQTGSPSTSQTRAVTREFARLSCGISVDGRLFCDFIWVLSELLFSTLYRTRSNKIFLISAELSYPRLRVLLHFDTQEFLNVLSMVSRFN